MPIDVSDLTPAFGAKMLALEKRAAAEGIIMQKTSGKRGFAPQALFYTTFRRSQKEAREKYGVVSQPAPMGLSKHHGYFEGKAAACDFDVVGIAATAARDAARRIVGRMAVELGLIYGGDWQTPDPVHVEMPGVDTAAEYVKLGERLDRMAGNLITATPPLPGGGT